jgi:hypothetical protein
VANEIMILTTTPSQNGQEEIEALFVYVLDPVIVVNSIVAVPTPSETLPPIVEEFGLAPQNFKDDLDAGEKVFEPYSFTRPPNMSAQAVLAELRRAWNGRNVELISQLRRKYALTGTVLSV